MRHSSYSSSLKKTISLFLCLGVIASLVMACDKSSDRSSPYNVYRLNIPDLASPTGDQAHFFAIATGQKGIAVVYEYMHQDGEHIYPRKQITLLDPSGNKLEDIDISLLPEQKYIDDFGITRMYYDNDGTLRLILESYGDNASLPPPEQKWIFYTIPTADVSQSTVVSLSFSSDFANEHVQIRDTQWAFDAQGNIYCPALQITETEQQTLLIVFQPDGNEIHRFTENTDPEKGWTFGNKIFSHNGIVYVSGQDKTETFFAPIHLPDIKIDEKKSLFKGIATDLAVICEGLTAPIYVNPAGIHLLQMDTGTGNTLLRWDQTDLPIETNAAIEAYLLTETDILASISIVGNQNYYLLSPADHPELPRVTPKDSIDGKKILRIGIFEQYSMNPLWVNVIDQFLDENPDYAVEYINYATMLTAFHIDLPTLQAEVTAAFFSAEPPDLLYLPYTHLDFPQLAKENRFVDLYPLLDGPRYERKQFYENILTAAETDGQLFYVPYAFQFAPLMMGRHTYIGDITHMTVETFVDIADSQPNLRPFPMNISVRTAIVQGEKDFHDDFMTHIQETPDIPYQAFVDLLHFSKKYGSRHGDYYQYVYAKEEEENFVEDKTMLLRFPIVMVHDFTEKWNTTDDSLSFFSYPSHSTYDLEAIPGPTIAISATSAYPEMCQKILKKMLHPMTQDNITNPKGFHTDDLPIRKSSMELAIALEQNPSEKTFISSSDPAYKNAPLSDEGAAAFRILLERIDKIQTNVVEDALLEDILREESVAFILGKKSAEETTLAIQSRIRTEIQ